MQELTEKAERVSLAFIATCAVDDDGNQLFTDAEDAEANLPDIGAKSFLEIGRKILDISGMGKPEKN